MHSEWRDELRLMRRSIRSWSQRREIQFQDSGFRVLEDHIRKGIDLKMIKTLDDMKFVMAVEALAAIDYSISIDETKIDEYVMWSALKKNHHPGEPPWKSITSIIRNRSTWLDRFPRLNRL